MESEVPLNPDVRLGGRGRGRGPRPWALLALAGALLGVGANEAVRPVEVSDFRFADGYRVEAVVRGLSAPTGAVFDGDDLLVAESGFKTAARPRVLRFGHGSVEVVAQAGLKPPVTGLLFHDGVLYVSHRGSVSVVEKGTLHEVLGDLPSLGDHQNNQIVAGPDGRIYMGQGTATNAGVVGLDGLTIEWLAEHPEVHDVPCQDVTLVGENFETQNPLGSPGDKARTGAYEPLGTPSHPGELVKGSLKCGGSILSFRTDGSDLQVLAWGLRNPFGLAFDEAGQLWAISQGADVRGSRSIFNDPDSLVRVERGAWYGWPDFFDGEPVTAARFRAPDKARPRFLWQQHPPLVRAFTTFASHSAAAGLAFSPGGPFGFAGDAFVAAFGTFAPLTTGINMLPVGFRVVRVDVRTGEVHDFVKNDVPGPAHLTGGSGFNRPVHTLFGPDGALYVVDWGAAEVTRTGFTVVPATGVVWRVFREGMASRGPEPMVVPPAPLSGGPPDGAGAAAPYSLLRSKGLIAAGVVLAIALASVALLRRLRRARPRA